MKRPELDSPAAQQRSLAAAEWLVKFDRGLTAAEQDAFSDWLAADPRHGDWLALHRSMVGDFSLLTQWRPEHSGEPNPDLLARPARRIHWLAPAVLAAAAVIAIAFFRPSPSPKETVAEVAGAAELERRILQDGSTVDLNRGAVVTVNYTAEVRRVTLVRGEALFTVTKNSERPFVVAAGGVDVRAVGTAFNVRLAATDVEVLVTEGQVAVASASVPAGTSASPSASADAARAIIPLLAEGQRATVSLQGTASPEIVAVTRAESDRLLAWQPQLLDFSSAPLEFAVAELNRRNRVQFVIADPELAVMPIIASIRSDKVEGFAQFLAATPGVQIERRSENEIVLRRRQ